VKTARWREAGTDVLLLLYTKRRLLFLLAKRRDWLIKNDISAWIPDQVWNDNKGKAMIVDYY